MVLVWVEMNRFCTHAFISSSFCTAYKLRLSLCDSETLEAICEMQTRAPIEKRWANKFDFSAFRIKPWNSSPMESSNNTGKAGPTGWQWPIANEKKQKLSPEGNTNTLAISSVQETRTTLPRGPGEESFRSSGSSSPQSFVFWLTISTPRTQFQLHPEIGSKW